MNLYPISVATPAILCLFTIFAAASYNPAYLTGDISVNCGSTGTSVASNGREWHGDVDTKIDSSLQTKGSSSSSSVMSQSHRELIAPADPVPYKTARITRSKFSYAFQVIPGLKLIRLHFNPTKYKGFQMSKDLFIVESGAFTLLGNFSASLTADALGVETLVKEFYINIEENQILDIVFTSASSRPQDGTYAFINGIEIISVPKDLSYFHGEDLGAQVSVQKAMVYIDKSTALERIHKVIILQDSILSAEDSAEIFEIEATIQTQKRHRSKTKTWKISVDVGFRYLVRIHFSKSGLKMAESGHQKFEFLINHMIANIDADTTTDSNDNGTILYRNYISVMKGNKQEGKRDLLISLQSRDESIESERPLKGFEIFKLSNPDNSLVCPSQLPTAQELQSATLQNLVSVLGYSNGVATAAISMIVLVNIIVHRLRQFWEKNLGTKETKPSVKGERLCLRFSLAEIRAATQNFNDEFVIGNGGFGTVYKGLLNDAEEIVAIKRLRLNSEQGEHEFWREVETLSELRHLNLVSLIGYCNEHNEMILVYDYMPGGTFADHLFYKKADDSNDSPSLSWNQRLSICIGAGRGLDYLHTGNGIIHRDIKSSNILLDENLVAKISDFGLAKPETRNILHSYVTTNVKGTFGYFDPHYFRTRKLTRKSDTYAFGVVLLEVLCGRPALDPRVEENKHSLTMWAREKISAGELEKIISSDLRGDISLDSLKTFVEVVECCLNDVPKRRPTMAEVVFQLEFALKQHESSRQVTEKNVSDVFPYTDEIISSASTENPTTTSINELSISSSSKEKNAVNAKLTSRERFGKPLTKQPRFSQWDVLWKRAKKSPIHQLKVSISEQSKLLMKRQVSLIKDYVTGVKATELNWATIEFATNRFSHSNMIGKGLGGAYYKAVLPTRQVIAVKRSSVSEYGHNEFKLEMYLLSQLKHPNLTKLLGYTIHGEEMILAYEFKAETSLHAVLFGRDQLSWTHRFKIIRGIAEGVLYLHQDSELRKLYGDLEPHNIILDAKMNPKIAFDFENKPGKDLPILLRDDKSNVHTDYASVECNPGREISLSSDVHSFGVMILEIVSGMKHRRSSKEGLDLIAYAWKLWNEEKPLYLMEASTWVSGFSQEEVLRCIRVALLCTQQQSKYRPMMPLVLRSLQGYHELQSELEERSRENHSPHISGIHKGD